MTPAKARLSGLLFPLLLLAAAWFLVVPHGSDRDGLPRAELQTAGLLVPGDDVRIRGATSGTVRDVELTRRGTAMVTFELERDVPALRADATASVRDADLLGGTFLAIEPGTARAALTAPIPTERTFAAVRVQDMFDTFDAPTRTALQTLVGELAAALDRRGIDLNGAVLELAPALRAARETSAQLASQDAQLQRGIVALQRLTAQLAPRSRDAERLVDGLDRSLAVTARRSRDLDRGLSALPATLRQLRGSLGRLERTAQAARPVVGDLGAAAPHLAQAARRLRPFGREARTALGDLRPLLRSARATLGGGARSLRRLRRATATVVAEAPALAAFASMLRPYADYLVKGVFGGIGGLAAEPGEQAFSRQPGRNYFRGEAVLGCETFGVPTRPGCLTQLVGATVAARERRLRRGARPPRRPAARRLPPRAPLPKPPARETVPGLAPSQVPDAVRDLDGGVRGLLDLLLRP